MTETDTTTTTTTRIPSAIDTETKLLGRYTLSDAGVVLAPAAVVVVLARLAVPAGTRVAGHGTETLSLPLAVAGGIAGVALVRLTPAHTTSFAWLASYLQFLARDRRRDHSGSATTARVARVHTAADAIERTDGTLLALVEVDPPSMALATDAEWTRAAASFREFLDTTVAFPLQLYSTTRQLEGDDYLAPYEERLEAVEAEENPTFEALLASYVEWYREQLDRREITVRDHYVVVPVSPAEVSLNDSGWRAHVRRLPVVGPALATLTSPATAQRAALIAAVEDRTRRVVAGLRQVEGCDARRLPAAEAAAVVGEFWDRDAGGYGDPDAVFGTAAPPAAGGGTE